MEVKYGSQVGLTDKTFHVLFVTSLTVTMCGRITNTPFDPTTRSKDCKMCRDCANNITDMMRAVDLYG